MKGAVPAKVNWNTAMMLNWLGSNPCRFWAGVPSVL